MTGALKKEEFEFFRQALRKMTGVSLQESKLRLVEARLAHRVSLHKLESFADYRRWLVQSENREEWQLIVNCLTTHTTQWFREDAHFDHLKNEVIPAWRENSNGATFRVWSAASSSGEEVYSIAMLLDSLLPAGTSFEVLGTDIDTNVLATAKNGVYPSDGLDRIPLDYQRRAIAVGKGNVQGWMKIKQAIKDRVRFSQLNLAKGPYQHKLPFDVIFCRNVLIYFDQETVAQVANWMFQSATENATLYTGHTESLANLKTPWIYKCPSIYTKGKGWGGGRR